MTAILIPTIQAVSVMIGLIAIGLLLKRKGIITNKHRPLFGQLVTDFALPALIFSTLAAQEPRVEILLAVLVMTTAVFCHLILSYGIGRLLHLERRQLGAFMLVAAFGSSATLGYALATQIFSRHSGAVTDAVMISELGVGVPLFFVGVLVAMHFGNAGGGSVFSSIRSYFMSPIFIALVAGCIASFLFAGVKNPAWHAVTSIFSLIGLSLTVFVSLGIALMLRWIPLRTIGLLAIITVVLALILQPLIALFLSDLIHLPATETDILILETAMPSGMIAAVLSDRYGCDGELASVLVIVTYLFAIVTLPLMMLLAP
jgi:malate permease and related proteins